MDLDDETRRLLEEANALERELDETPDNAHTPVPSGTGLMEQIRNAGGVVNEQSPERPALPTEVFAVNDAVTSSADFVELRDEPIEPPSIEGEDDTVLTSTTDGAVYLYQTLTPEDLENVVDVLSSAPTAVTIANPNVIITNVDVPIVNATAYANAPDFSESEKVLDLIREKAEYYYPGNWDLQLAADNETAKIYYLYILFPEVTIKNTQNQSWDIKDLYMRLFIDVTPDKINVVRIEGARGKLNYREFLKGYAHSHLNGNKQFTEFCLGDSPLNSLLAEVALSGIKADNIIMFEALLQELTNLAEWESMEGVPYQYMRDLLEPINASNYSATEINEEIERVKEMAWENVKGLFNFTSIFNIIFDELESTLEINVDSKFSEWLLPYCQLHQARDSRGHYYNPISTAIVDHEEFVTEDFTEFTFKGETIKQIVEEYHQDGTDWPEGVQRHPHKDVINVVADSFNYYINNVLKEVLKLKLEYENRKFYGKIPYHLSKSKQEDFIPVFTNSQS